MLHRSAEGNSFRWRGFRRLP